MDRPRKSAGASCLTARAARRRNEGRPGAPPGPAARRRRSRAEEPGRAGLGQRHGDVEDADAMTGGVEADARADLDDVLAIRQASGLESHRARAARERAGEDEQDGRAIARAEKLWSEAADAQGERELKDPKDRDALVRAVALEAKEEDQDAAQIQLLASKEKADSDATEMRALSMGADAEELEHVAMANWSRRARTQAPFAPRPPMRLARRGPRQGDAAGSCELCVRAPHKQYSGRRTRTTKARGVM
ncbi:unnamed protein product [Prorocentrum cordatum]|uniref:Uncharacterized protein n=1 Tax=Prorocentrum cordatum TaxID=2364126 RepID=A0ABN9RW95_9DINO|nr:unnamed protein product [Polarella glacialis]